MLQQTSLEAYREIRSSLGSKQRTVLNVISNHVDLTNSEIAKILGWSINTVTPRVFEIRKQGLVTESRKRICSVTGRRCIAWKKTFLRFGEQYG